MHASERLSYSLNHLWPLHHQLTRYIPPTPCRSSYAVLRACGRRVSRCSLELIIVSRDDGPHEDPVSGYVTFGSQNPYVVLPLQVSGLDNASSVLSHASR